MRTRVVASIAATALAAVVTASCEQGLPSGVAVTGAVNDAGVRLINALTASQALDFLVDGNVAATGTAFGAASPYAGVSASSHRLQARGSTSGTILIDFTRDLASGGSYSLIPAPGLSQFGALFIQDDPTPAAGSAKLRGVHVAAAPGAVSIYITGPSDEISSATPAIPALVFGAASPYVTVPPGSYRIRITPVGAPSTILVDSGNLNLSAGSVRTLLVTDAPGGGLPTTLSVILDTP
jgi:uncharacterized protein DUF4397